MSLNMEPKFQVQMPLEASLEITWMDCAVFEVFLNRRPLAALKNATAKLRFDALNWRNVATTKPYSRKRNCILRQTQRHHTCHPLPLHKVPIKRHHRHMTLHVLRLQISYTRHCRFYHLAARMFTIRDSFPSSIYR